jgi:hypothetical protein
MAGVILTEADYPSVRRALDVSLDLGVTDDAKRTLPNAVIEDPVFLDAAEAEVMRAYPPAGDVDALPIDEAGHVRRWTILVTAARIAPRLPSLTSEGFADQSWAWKRTGLDELVTTLRAEAEGIRLGLTGPGDAGGFLSSGRRFRTSGQRRGY